MNWTPTALLVFLLLLIAVVSLFGGYFGYITGDTLFETDPPEDLWGLITDAGEFYWGLMTMEIEGLPEIFSVIWWVINALGLYCVIKIIWPGA